MRKHPRKRCSLRTGAANGKEWKLALTISWFVIALWLFRGARVLPRRIMSRVSPELSIVSSCGHFPRRWCGTYRSAETWDCHFSATWSANQNRWVVGEKVRREKALDFSGCNSRPGTGSLHPVAIEAAAEATKLSELSLERVARRLREHTGRNESER
jgi:hypothetical protein